MPECSDRVKPGQRGPYLVPMTSAPQSMIVATYVRDIDASRAFYELLGFTDKRSGASPDSAWSELSGAGHLILLVATDPPLAVPRLPLLF